MQTDSFLPVPGMKAFRMADVELSLEEALVNIFRYVYPESGFPSAPAGESIKGLKHP